MRSMPTRVLVAAAVTLASGACSPTVNTMKRPTEHDPWVIRTDFASDDGWSDLCKMIAAPQTDAGMKFYAYVRYVNDVKYRDKEAHELILSLPDDYPGMFCFIVDRECIINPEHPILVVGFYPSDNESFDRPPRETPRSDLASFRALPSKVQEIENNLSIANVDFEEFAGSVGDDGIYRGVAR
jgi:hypothetical protein